MSDVIASKTKWNAADDAEVQAKLTPDLARFVYSPPVDQDAGIILQPQSIRTFKITYKVSEEQEPYFL